MMIVMVSLAEKLQPDSEKLSSDQVVAEAGSTEASWQEVPEASITSTLMSLLAELVLFA